MKTGPSTVSLDSWRQKEQLLEKFEEAWSRGVPPNLADFLPEDCPDRRALLVELVRVDRECRRKAGLPAQYDFYLKSFPELPQETIAFDGGTRSLVDGTAESLPAAGPQTVDEPRPALYSFLAPAQQAGELGRLGDHRVLKILGEGGMGLVFLAEDTRLKREVALKVLKPDATRNAEAVRRFLHEAQMMAKLDHDHVVTVYQVDQAGNVPYFTMPFLRGETLYDRLRHDPPLTPAQVIRIGREVAQGLAAAHAKDMIHRDVKPANIWLEAGSERVKLLDFGLVRGTEQNLNLTREGTLLGTPEYMAPEQANDKPVDGRADLFSLGCVLYQISTGKSPFKRHDLLSTLCALEQDQPKEPSELVAHVPLSLSRLILQLLEKDRLKRPASAAEVVQALKDIENQPVSAATGTADPRPPSLSAQPAPTHPPTVEAPSPQPPRKSRWRLALTVSGLAAVILISLGFIWHRNQPVVLEEEPVPELADWTGEKPGEVDKLGLTVKVMGTKPNDKGIHQFKAGDRITFDVKVKRTAYVSIWSVNLDGVIVQLFPNEHEKDNVFQADEPRTIPGKGPGIKNYSIIAQVDKGIECFRVLASTTNWKPTRGEKAGDFLVFSSDADKRDLRAVLRSPALVETPDAVPVEMSDVVVKYKVRPK